MKDKNKDSYASLFSNIWFVLKFLFKSNKTLFLARIPLIVVQSLSTFIPIIFVRLILNEITVGKDLKKVVILACAFALAIFVSGMIDKLLSMADSKELEKAMYKSNLALGQAAMKLEYYKLEEPKTKDFLSLAENSNPSSNILAYLTGFAGALIRLIGLSAIVLTLQPIILAFIIAVVVVRILIDQKMRKINTKYREEIAPKDRKFLYFWQIANFLQFGKEVRINKLEPWVTKKTEEHFDNELLPSWKNNQKKKLKWDGLTGVISVAQEILVYAVLAYKVIFTGMSIGDFSMYMTSVDNFADSVYGVTGCYSNLMGQGVLAKEFRYFIEGAKDNIKEQQKRRKATDMSIFSDSINLVFKNVSFKYPNTERLILDDISFELKNGETLSIVGLNGAGKTTLVKLICRLYKPTSGSILINNVDINNIPFDEYTKLLGVVFQDFKLFPFTVRENVELKMISDPEKLSSSIKDSGLSEKVNSLPKKSNTMVYKEFDSEGMEFSGGEGQKIAISRAIYKDAPFIILDEPTSALDPIAEFDIYNHFNRMSKNKTTIYISHRLSSSRFTDHILVLQGGKLVEFGNHKKLMDIPGGVYKEMFEMQAQYYK